MNINLPSNIIQLAESTLPEGENLDNWIITWLEFGLEVSLKASSRKEAIDLGASIEKTALKKIGEIVEEHVENFEGRLNTLENLTDVTKKDAGFGKLLHEIQVFVDPENTKSIIYKYNEMLKKVENEDGLIRKAIRAEDGSPGGIRDILRGIVEKLKIEEIEKNFSRKSTLIGDKFEDSLILVANQLFPSNAIVFTKTKGQIGFSPHGSGDNKKGDVRIDFGDDHVLNGSSIIIEAKSDSSFFQNYPSNPTKCASSYLDKAMVNRRSNFGIWVQDSNSANANKWPKEFLVTGNKIFLVWDPDDPTTDWRLLSAIFIAMGRCKTKSKSSGDNLEEIDRMEELISDLTRVSELHPELKKRLTNITSNAKAMRPLLLQSEDIINDTINRFKEILSDNYSDLETFSDISFDNVDSTIAEEEE